MIWTGHDQREFIRYACDLPATVVGPYGDISVQILNISAGGAKMQGNSLAAQTFTGKGFFLCVAEHGTFPITWRWQRNDEFGVSFDVTQSRKLLLTHTLALRFGKSLAALVLAIPFQVNPRFWVGLFETGIASA